MAALHLRAIILLTALELSIIQIDLRTILQNYDKIGISKIIHTLRIRSASSTWAALTS